MIATTKKIKVRVTKKVHSFAVDGVRYVPGDELEVSEHVFKRNAARGILVKVEPPQPKKADTVKPVDPEIEEGALETPVGELVTPPTEEHAKTEKKKKP